MADFNLGISSGGVNSLGDPTQSWISAYSGYKPGNSWNASSGNPGDQKKINRLQNAASNFDSAYYLKQNPDVAQNMMSGDGWVTSAYEHFVKHGQGEGRSWRNRDGNVGSAGTGNFTNPDWNKISSNTSSSSNSGSSGSGNSTTTTDNSLFGTGGYLGTGVNFDDYVNKMKELTDWKLGIDKKSMGNAYGFRDQEATRDYGFQTGLAGQQIQGQKDIQGQQIEGTKNLETLRNEYMGQRQTQQLENQKAMQQSGFNQQSKLLNDNAGRAKSLYFGLGSMR
jgi:hypothetical protein